jgi:hypothetical protein
LFQETSKTPEGKEMNDSDINTHYKEIFLKMRTKPGAIYAALLMQAINENVNEDIREKIYITFLDIVNQYEEKK